MLLKNLFFLAFFFLQISATAQKATIKGVVSDEKNRTISEASVHISGSNTLYRTDENGQYSIEIDANKRVAMRITALGFEPEPFSVQLQEGEILNRNITLRFLFEDMKAVDITDKSYRNEAGTMRIGIENVRQMPGMGGIEGLLKVIVGSNNELTSQYTVRGGNFDENLVYVNDFEIYRPFLVRSGQQEGLSFINADLVQSVQFSVGGFQAKYGDKLSSALDVKYKRPQKLGGSAMLSLLGLQAHLEGSSVDKKLTYLIGIRQKSNQYLLQAQPTEGVYNPSFTDIQTLISYKINNKWETEIIANYARNRFRFIPNYSEATFGVYNNSLRLQTYFDGNEIDQFDSRYGGWSLAYKPTEHLRFKLLASIFQTNEFETYDIKGEYGFYAVETDLGKKEQYGENKYALGTGIIHDFARNFLTAHVGNIALKGSYDAGKHYWLAGADMGIVHVSDQMLEWQRRDSAGFSQPYHPSKINLANSVNAKNNLIYNKFSFYVQDNVLLGSQNNMTLNVGLRATLSMLNQEFILSPRIQYSIRPNWTRDIVFRLSTGLYAQPPFYREMRDMSGQLHTNLKAQKSYHIAGGWDYNFKMWGDRPFKLTFEAYYKQLWDIVPYEYDNVRIRYFANNNGVGYAYGGEIRLFGDLVKDAESWVSLGLLKTENRVFDEATEVWSPMLARPTDQRMSLGVFFSDYLPRNKNFKTYLNLMYATGLPFSFPGKAFNPAYQRRIPDYKRVDIGFSALLLDGAKKEKRPAYSFFNSFESIWVSFEVFNLLNIQNTISYQWIQDYTTQNIFAVPNRLTQRLINLKLAIRF